MTGAVNNTTNTTNTTNTSGTSNTNSQLADTNFQDFLQLLTTQLQNQDPTAPTDTNELTQQIATLSEVEQQISTNNNLQQLLSMYNSTQTSSLVSYIGKDIDASGNSGYLQNGQALFAYTLPEAASTATMTITDSTGKTVYSGAVPTTAGRNQVLWDGTDSNGNTLADGTYTFAVTADDSTGNAITATTLTTGIVTSVDTSGGTTSLSIGNLSVPVSTIESVRDLSTDSGTASNTGTTTTGTTNTGTTNTGTTTSS